MYPRMSIPVFYRGGSRYHCNQCQRRFKYAKTARRHVWRVHLLHRKEA
jgi:uncharacterized C2H2 Zn-finger protein